MSFPDLYQIRNNIRLLRKSRGITQKEIACKLFIEERTYSKIERGEKKSIDISLLTAIAGILQTDITHLLQDTPEEQQMAYTLTDPEIKNQISSLQQTQAALMEVMENMQEKISKLVTTNDTLLELLQSGSRQIIE